MAVEDLLKLSGKIGGETEDTPIVRSPDTSEEPGELFSRLITQQRLADAGGLIGGSARSTLAEITRQQWEDYKKRFFPLENKLISAYDNQARKDKQIREAMQSARLASNTVNTANINRLARYGLNPYDDPAYKREFQMGKTASIADAANEARRHAEEVDRMLLSGGLTSKTDVSA